MIFGLIVGSFFFLIIDDILSIQQMNSWGWKTIYIFLSLVTLIFMSILYKFNSLITLDFQEIKNASNNDIKLKKNFFKNIFIIILLLCLLFILLVTGCLNSQTLKICNSWSLI